MQEANGAAKSKHVKTFWAIVIILVVALIAGGLVSWFKFQYNYDEDMNALEIRLTTRKHTDKAPVMEQTLPAGSGVQPDINQ